MSHKFSVLMIVVLVVMIALLLGAVDPALAKQDKDHKIDICHKGRTIEIDEHAWKGHKKHGDTKGACKNGGDDPTDVTDTSDPDDQPAPASSGGGSDSDVSAITRLGAYNASTGKLIVYTVGDVGSFRLKKMGARGASWFDVPSDWLAINHNEHRGTLDFFLLPPGTYQLFAHHWASRNSGDDGEDQFTVPKNR